MLAREERERLLAAIRSLYARSGDGEADPAWVREVRSQPRGAFAGMLEAADEEVVEAISAALAEIAGLVAKPDAEGVTPPPTVVIGPLGGVELVMRGEIMAGNMDRLPKLLPGFAFLVTLPLLGEEEALRLSRRAAELIDGASQ